MFEKIPAANRLISLKGRDLLEGKKQIAAKLTNGFSIVSPGNNPCKEDIQNINVSCYFSVYRTHGKTWQKQLKRQSIGQTP